MLSLLRSHDRRRSRPDGVGPADVLPPTVERDRDLLEAARSGEAAAVDELYRLHAPVARGVAHGLCRPSDVDDVVSEAFARVLDQISRGGGPRTSFRAYLITAVRSAATDLARRNARLVLTDDVEGTNDERPDPDEPDTAVREESRLLAEALGALSPRWQLVLWWTTVERRPLSEVGRLLGLSPNAVAALAFRARQGLRETYLRLHLPAPTDPACAAWHADLAASLTRIPPSRPGRDPAHPESCEACRDLTLELRDSLRSWAH